MRVERVKNHDEAPFCTLTLTRKEADALLFFLGTVSLNDIKHVYSKVGKEHLAGTHQALCFYPMYGLLQEVAR